MLPAVGLAGLLMAQIWISAEGEGPWLYCIYGNVPVMLILAAQSLAMFYAYYTALYTNQFVARRRALAENAETRLFEMARMMHPEAVRLLLMHRKVVWRIKQTPLKELVDWVLDADPRVHVGFVEYVLQHSNFYALMPKHDLSDKSHSFDSERLVTDYEQYDAFVTILQRRGMLTQAFGNQAGQWIDPWNPELAARQFGIVDLYEEEAAAGSETSAEQESGLKSAVQS
jgi:hypothetical protein